jgi:hypothetical protein
MPAPDSLPEPVPPPGAETPREVGGAIERAIADVPTPRTGAVSDPAEAAAKLAREAAQKAALLSGSLALPPGPLGMLTVLPDLYLIWKVQRQMVADIFALHGRSAELTRTHMLYCLFRHMASHVLRDVAVRTGQRVVVRQLSAGALRGVTGTIGVAVTRKLAGTAAGRWVPLAGAAAVGAYAYWDTLQVAKTARRLLEESAVESVETAAQPHAHVRTRARRPPDA